MKTYQLGEDKVVNVKQELEELKVTIENTDSKSTHTKQVKCCILLC